MQCNSKQTHDNADALFSLLLQIRLIKICLIFIYGKFLVTLIQSSVTDFIKGIRFWGFKDEHAYISLIGEGVNRSRFCGSIKLFLLFFSISVEAFLE